MFDSCTSSIPFSPDGVEVVEGDGGLEFPCEVSRGRNEI